MADDVIKYEPEVCREAETKWSGTVSLKTESYRKRMRQVSEIARKAGVAKIEGGNLSDQVELMLGILDHVESLVVEVNLTYDGQAVESFAAIDSHQAADDVLNDLAAAYQRGWALEKN